MFKGRFRNGSKFIACVFLYFSSNLLSNLKVAIFLEETKIVTLVYFKVYSQEVWFREIKSMT